jgi:excisionase family DNA binding protein
MQFTKSGALLRKVLRANFEYPYHDRTARVTRCSRCHVYLLVPVTQMLTTQQAANILNVSRPYFVGLLEKGEIAFDLVGRHRRVKAQDLFEYKNTRDSERASALDKLAQIDADLI